MISKRRYGRHSKSFRLLIRRSQKKEPAVVAVGKALSLRRGLVFTLFLESESGGVLRSWGSSNYLSTRLSIRIQFFKSMPLCYINSTFIILSRLILSFYKFSFVICHITAFLKSKSKSKSCGSEKNVESTQVANTSDFFHVHITIFNRQQWPWKLRKAFAQWCKVVSGYLRQFPTSAWFLKWSLQFDRWKSIRPFEETLINLNWSSTLIFQRKEKEQDSFARHVPKKRVAKRSKEVPYNLNCFI